MKSIALLVVVLLSHASSAPQSPGAPVSYPEGYREWTHVKSALTRPVSAEVGGKPGEFQHVYANARALEGYRTRSFPEGSVIVFDWLEIADQRGQFVEGARRQVDVMVKDSTRFSTTGGWGFQRFVGGSHTELAATPAPAQCYACHLRLQRDGLVLSKYRP